MVKKKSLAWQNCSEAELESNIAAWAKETDLSNSVLLLEGEMGSGKSTFVRALLMTLAPKVRSTGSPTFPLIQMYAANSGFPIYHIDLYRLKSERELQDSGIESHIEEKGALACVEWPSLFPGYFGYWLDSSKKKQKEVWKIEIASTLAEARDYQLSKL